MQITECLAANAELFGWTGRDWSGRDLEYELALRLAVAYEAEWATLRAVEEHDSRDRFFFRRFALMQCSASASDALRRSLDFAVRHVPRFDEVFNCKPQGFKNCFSSYGT